MEMDHSVLEFISIGSNLAMVGVGIKLVRHLAKIEFRVDMMWKVFMKEHIKAADDDSDEEDEPDEDVA